jgi:hypothetical protein
MQRKLILMGVLAVALSALAVLPGVADARLGTGRLLRTIDDTAVYYINEDGLRYVFPNANIFNSWHEDFSDVEIVESGDLADYPFGGVMPYKPGKRLVKMKTSPKVYLVDEDGSLRWVKTEQLARKLYGPKWMKMVDDLPESFFVQYEEGEDVGEEEGIDPEDLSDEVDDGRATLRKRETHRHGHNKVTLCHIRDGYQKTLYLPQPAVDAHLRNHSEDHLGACDAETPDDDDDDSGDSGSGNDNEDPDYTDLLAILNGTEFHQVEYVKADGLWLATECPVEADAVVGLLIGLSSATIVDTDGNLTGTLTGSTFGNCTDQDGWADLKVSDLSAGSAYSYQVVFYDPADGTSEVLRLPAGEFNTYADGAAPAVAFDVTVDDIAGTTATVSWTANYPLVGATWVDYGTAADALDTNSDNADRGFDENGLNYEVGLIDLTAATDYFLVVNGYSWLDESTVAVSDPPTEFATPTP